MILQVETIVNQEEIKMEIQKLFQKPIMVKYQVQYYIMIQILEIIKTVLFVSIYSAMEFMYQKNGRIIIIIINKEIKMD